jgi:hypothetical protein
VRERGGERERVIEREIDRERERERDSGRQIIPICNLYCPIA